MSADYHCHYKIVTTKVYLVVKTPYPCGFSACQVSDKLSVVKIKQFLNFYLAKYLKIFHCMSKQILNQYFIWINYWINTPLSYSMQWRLSLQVCGIMSCFYQTLTNVRLATCARPAVRIRAAATCVHVIRVSPSLRTNWPVTEVRHGVGLTGKLKQLHIWISWHSKRHSKISIRFLEDYPSLIWEWTTSYASVGEYRTTFMST